MNKYELLITCILAFGIALALLMIIYSFIKISTHGVLNTDHTLLMIAGCLLLLVVLMYCDYRRVEHPKENPPKRVFNSRYVYTTCVQVPDMYKS